MSNSCIKFMLDNRSSLLKHLRKKVKSQDVAEDLYQGVTESILRYADPDMDIALAPRYVYTSINRAAARYFEEERRRTYGEVDNGDIANIGLTFDQLHGDALDVCEDPESRFIRAEKTQEVLDRIQDVPNETHQDMLRCLFEDGASYAETARAFNTSSHNVRMVVYRFIQLNRGG